MHKFASHVDFIRDLYKAGTDTMVPLHAPVFAGNEKKYVADTIDSTFVSSVGEYVNEFERKLEKILNVPHAIACVNGTSALEIALRLAGVKEHDVVLTQSLTFVATANAIAHIGASPVFLDVSTQGFGLSPYALRDFLEQKCYLKNNVCYLKCNDARVGACVPMHTFGFACDIENIVNICKDYNIPVVEDAAEALGSAYKGKALGTFGLLSALSFNGNKIVTTGGGGAIITHDDTLAKEAKKLTTTAKVAHKYRFYHDEVAWNFRLPNINAALGCAQLEKLYEFLVNKRQTAMAYKEHFCTDECLFVNETEPCRANFWLCAVLLEGEKERDEFLEYSNDNGVMTRPCWEGMHTLPMYKDCIRDDLKNTKDICSRLVNIPSGVRL